MRLVFGIGENFTVKTSTFAALVLSLAFTPAACALVLNTAPTPAPTSVTYTAQCAALKPIVLDLKAQSDAFAAQCKAKSESCSQGAILVWAERWDTMSAQINAACGLHLQTTTYEKTVQAMAPHRSPDLSDYEYNRQADAARDNLNHQDLLRAQDNVRHAYGDYFAAEEHALGTPR
jgi:hypothetical protein